MGVVRWWLWFQKCSGGSGREDGGRNRDGISCWAVFDWFDFRTATVMCALLRRQHVEVEFLPLDFRRQLR